MKIKWFLLIAVCGVLAAGCATTGSSSSGSTSSKSAEEKAADEKKKQEWKNQKEGNPEVGMTKEQVSTLYGKPDHTSVSSEGETWSYNVNAGQAWIPFNYGYRPKFRVITFNKDGKVAHWSFNQ